MSDPTPIKTPVVIFNPDEDRPNPTKSPAERYREMFSPGIKEEATLAPDTQARPDARKPEASKP